LSAFLGDVNGSAEYASDVVARAEVMRAMVRGIRSHPRRRRADDVRTWVVAKH
jgi:hypothetical protein